MQTFNHIWNLANSSVSHLFKGIKVEALIAVPHVIVRVINEVDAQFDAARKQSPTGHPKTLLDLYSIEIWVLAYEQR
jgi:hypothetical protein